MAETLLDRITRAVRDLGGEAQLAEIRRRVLAELGEANDRRSRH